MNAPLISIIIPVFNYEKYLPEAIQSVLDQSYKNTQVIVVDDGSDDNSLAVAKSFLPNIEVLTQPNGGIGLARNAGINRARGEYLAFLDADDLWVSQKLEVQIQLIRERPELDMVFGHVVQFLSPENAEELEKSKSCPQGEMPGFIAGTMLVKTETFLKVGLFNSQWKIGEFVDWYSRAKDAGLKEFLMEKILLKRRIHETNQGIREKESRRDYIYVLKAALDRRRKKEKISI